MPNQVSFRTLIVVAFVATVVGIVGGNYVGRKAGYAEGVAKGLLAGFDMSSQALISGKLGSDVKTLPVEAGPLGQALCAGFRKGLPCKSISEAMIMLASSDPVERIRGEACRSALTNLQGCGEGVMPATQQ